MQLPIPLLALAGILSAQPLAGTDQTTSKEDQAARLHKDALAFVDATKVKANVEAHLSELFDKAKAQILSSSTCNAAFADEWVSRMRSRVTAQDFANVVAGVYEQQFTAEELESLTEMVEAKARGENKSLAPELQKKFANTMPTVEGAIMGGCVQLSTKIGAEIGQQIEKEHPDYCKQPSEKKRQKPLS